jgi:hypothetical protein
MLVSFLFSGIIVIVLCIKRRINESIPKHISNDKWTVLKDQNTLES